VKIGEDRYSNIIGSFGLGIQNERGKRFEEWRVRNGQVITNTWFKQHPRRLYPWTSPGYRTRNQIDFMTINQRFRNAVKSSKSSLAQTAGVYGNKWLA